MGTRSLLTAVVVSAMLAGCASPLVTKEGFDPKYDVLECKSSAPCNVDVVVNKGCATFSNCFAIKTGTFVVISGGATPTITWALKESDADDFEFAPNDTGGPIKFLNDAGDFACDASADKPVKQVTCKKSMSNTDFKIYKYQISGRPFKGAHFPVTPLDPWVINK